MCIFRDHAITEGSVVHYVSRAPVITLFIFVTNGSAEKGVSSFYSDSYLKDKILSNIFDLRFNKELQHEEIMSEFIL